jgi:predicted enzyme related to lactoylglutathione lyase
MSTHGYIHWNELLTHDVEKTKAFYGATVGWTYSSMPMAGGSYWLFMPEGADKPAGGMMEVPLGGDMPTDRWFTYLAVDDIDGALSRIAAHGGKVLRPAFDVPGVGRIAIIEDATGAVMGWMTPVEAS